MRLVLNAYMCVIAVWHFLQAGCVMAVGVCSEFERENDVRVGLFSIFVCLAKFKPLWFSFV